MPGKGDGRTCCHMSQSRPWPGCDLVLEKKAAYLAEVKMEVTILVNWKPARTEPCLARQGVRGENLQRAKWIMSEQLSKLLGRRGQRKRTCEMDFTRQSSVSADNEVDGGPGHL